MIYKIKSKVSQGSVFDFAGRIGLLQLRMVFGNHIELIHISIILPRSAVRVPGFGDHMEGSNAPLTISDYIYITFMLLSWKNHLASPALLGTCGNTPQCVSQQKPSAARTS